MKVSLNTVAKMDVGTISTRCPHCGKEGTFERPINEVYDLSSGPQGHILGIRRCPNKICRGHLFFIMKSQKWDIFDTYPPIKIDFNSEGIPDRIRSTFEEALTCHSNKCYISSAIMIRRTLEEICHDRGASGNNLKQKIASLRDIVILPEELLDAADDLRLLGNDAAHIESNEFSQISDSEVNISIILTKEIIKAIYQYKNLLSELRNLKRNS